MIGQWWCLSKRAVSKIRIPAFRSIALGLVVAGLSLPGFNAKAQGGDLGGSGAPRGTIIVREGGRSYQAPPKGYRSPHEGRVFGPSDSAAFIKRKAADILVDEIRHLQRYLAENRGDLTADTRRKIIRKTAVKTLQGLRPRLDRRDRERLIDWALVREGVREGEAADRQALLGRIRPGPPSVPLIRIPRLEGVAEKDCPLAVRYPEAFDTVEETPQRKLRPSYEHFKVKKRTADSVVFVAPYAFRQEVPGPGPLDESAIQPSDKNAYERWKGPDTDNPPHPVIKRLRGNPEERFFLLTSERAFADHPVSVTEPSYFELGMTWYRYLQVEIPRESHGGDDIALGVVGDMARAPAMLQPETVEVARDHCLIRELARRIEEHHGGEAWFRVAYSLGSNGTTRRLALEYRLLGGEQDGPRVWTGFADLTDEALTVRYVPPLVTEHMERCGFLTFLTESGVTLLADRDHDGLGDMAYSTGKVNFYGTLPRKLHGTLILFGEPIRIQKPQLMTD